MISPQDLAELQRIVARLGDQDNLCTHQVMFCVQKQTRITGLDESLADDTQLMWVNQGEELPEDHWPKLTEAHENGDDEVTIDGEKWVVADLDHYAYRLDWETVQVFFTSEGAQRYMDTNKHRMSEHGEPRIYGESFHRNREMNTIRDSLPELVRLATLASQEDRS